MNKKLTAAVLAATLALASVMPAYAAVTRSTSNGIFYTDNQNINYPCWIWKDGFCYYYTNPGTILKNATTSDGYTVDSEGRWIQNGTVQTNGYGSYSMGTADYTGKSDAEIWNMMVDRLENVYKEAIPNNNTSGMTYAYEPTKDKGISFDKGDGATVGNEITVFHDNTSYGTYITAVIGNAWSDQELNVGSAVSKASYAGSPFVKEKTIKAIIGDQIGQELFSYVRAYAEKTTSGYISELDENGNIIHGYWAIDPSTVSEALPFGDPNAPEVWVDDPNAPGWRLIWSDNYGNGIAAETLDLSAWQNRTTDYGKRFSVVYDGGLRIHVYN